MEEERPRAVEDRSLSSSREHEFTLPSPLCFVGAFSGLNDAHCTGKGDLLYSVYSFKC